MLEQVWFRGTHGDVGGHLGGFEPARPLANIPLVWMLEKAEGCGIELPEGWRERFEQDPEAPSIGTLRGWGKMFFWRKRRLIGADPSESDPSDRVGAAEQGVSGAGALAHLHDDAGGRAGGIELAVRDAPDLAVRHTGRAAGMLDGADGFDLECRAGSGG